MICPTCGHDNLPGNEECANCLQDLTPLDRPMAQNRVERSLMEDPVSDLTPRTPITITPAMTVRQAIETMLTHNLGAVLVVNDSGKLVGILSERDLLKKVAVLPDPYAELFVEDYMTPNPETVTADDTLAFALHKMDVGGYRHMPVLSAGKPSGMISVRDMLRHITRLCRE
ncbi:MAG: CBS domain-containing protein [Gemmataceae bacterium]|nr:CBS domain-containing protein [Gemmataceae bacterium]